MKIILDIFIFFDIYFDIIFNQIYVRKMWCTMLARKQVDANERVRGKIGRGHSDTWLTLEQTCKVLVFDYIKWKDKCYVHIKSDDSLYFFLFLLILLMETDNNHFFGIYV